MPRISRDEWVRGRMKQYATHYTKKSVQGKNGVLYQAKRHGAVVSNVAKERSTSEPPFGAEKLSGGFQREPSAPPFDVQHRQEFPKMSTEFVETTANTIPTVPHLRTLLATYRAIDTSEGSGDLRGLTNRNLQESTGRFPTSINHVELSRVPEILKKFSHNISQKNQKALNSLKRKREDQARDEARPPTKKPTWDPNIDRASNNPYIPTTYKIEHQMWILTKKYDTPNRGLIRADASPEDVKAMFRPLRGKPYGPFRRAALREFRLRSFPATRSERKYNNVFIKPDTLPSGIFMNPHKQCRQRVKSWSPPGRSNLSEEMEEPHFPSPPPFKWESWAFDFLDTERIDREWDEYYAGL